MVFNNDLLADLLADMQVESASYAKHGGFDGVQEARREQLDAQAAARMKRKAAEAKKVQNKAY